MIDADSVIAKHLSCLEHSGQFLSASLSVPSDYPSFSGHFPGNPILPGVSMISICKYIFGHVTGKKLFLKNIKRTKFTAPVYPGDVLDISASFTESADGLSADVTIISGERRVSAMKLFFEEGT